MDNKNIGKLCELKRNRCEWGIIVAFDGDCYYVAFCGDRDMLLYLDRDEFIIPRNQGMLKVFYPSGYKWK